MCCSCQLESEMSTFGVAERGTEFSRSRSDRLEGKPTNRLCRLRLRVCFGKCSQVGMCVKAYVWERRPEPQVDPKVTEARVPPRLCTCSS